MKNELAYFTDTVNNLIEGKLILVDKNIAQVLQCVATVPALCKCLSDTVHQISYATEFSRARVTWTRPDGTVEAKLKLPAERDRLFAFVVCLLTEVDTGRRNFLEFLKEYYHETDNNLGYEKFINEALKPFKRAGEMILRSVDPESLNTESAAHAERFFNVEKIYIPSKVSTELQNETERVMGIIRFADSYAVLSRDDLLLACDYFLNALRLKNPKILGVSWLALKSLMQINSVVSESLQKMSQLMSQIPIA